MNASIVPPEEITQQEWEWVHDMIEEIDRQERREDFARWLFQWDFAVREFRKVEQRRIILGTPNAYDRRFHSLCLHSLLAGGHALVLHSEDFTPEELKQFGVVHEDITAYVAELEQSFREWNHAFTEAEIGNAQQAIFGGTA